MTPDLPPCDESSERLLVAEALLFGPRDGIEPKHFFFDQHRWIYEALIATDPLEPPLVRVVTELRARGSLASVGGSTELVRMLPDDLSALDDENMAVHAELLVERWRKRVVAEAANRIAAELRGEQLDSGEAWKRFKQFCTEAAA